MIREEDLIEVNGLVARYRRAKVSWWDKAEIRKRLEQLGVILADIPPRRAA
jgi:hypothetical protein